MALDILEYICKYLWSCCQALGLVSTSYTFGELEKYFCEEKHLFSKRCLFRVQMRQVLDSMT